LKSDFGSRLSRIEQVLVEISSDVRMLRTLTGLEPQSALNKIRYITEKVLVDVCRKHSVSWGPKEPTIESMVGPLVSKEILPRNQAVLVRTIQTNASAGSHYQESALTYTHVHIAQMALVDFLEWYCSERTSDLGLDIVPESVGSDEEGDEPGGVRFPKRGAWAFTEPPGSASGAEGSGEKPILPKGATGEATVES